MKEITIDDYLMGRDKTFPEEFNGTIYSNGKVLLFRVNYFLLDLGVENPVVSSGWRPPSYNKTVKGAAKRSLHQIGMAIDLLDSDGTLAAKILSDLKLLELHDLYLEHPNYTKGWVHLQGRAPGSGKRVFIP